MKKINNIVVKNFNEVMGAQIIQCLKDAGYTIHPLIIGNNTVYNSNEHYYGIINNEFRMCDSNTIRDMISSEAIESIEVISLEELKKRVYSNTQTQSTKLSSDFTDAKEGDLVTSYINGKGIITKIDIVNHYFTIICKFDNKEQRFTRNGKQNNTDKYPTLVKGHHNSLTISFEDTTECPVLQTNDLKLTLPLESLVKEYEALTKRLNEVKNEIKTIIE